MIKFTADLVTMNIGCRMCDNEVEVTMTPAQFNELKQPTRRNIQDIFPDMSMDKREMLMTSTCGECWERIFDKEIIRNVKEELL